MAKWKSSILTSIFSITSGGISSSSKLISGKYLRNAFIADSRTNAEISAPTNPYVLSNSHSALKSSLIGISLV